MFHIFIIDAQSISLLYRGIPNYNIFSLLIANYLSLPKHPRLFLRVSLAKGQAINRYITFSVCENKLNIWKKTFWTWVPCDQLMYNLLSIDYFLTMYFFLFNASVANKSFQLIDVTIWSLFLGKKWGFCVSLLFGFYVFSESIFGLLSFYRTLPTK